MASSNAPIDPNQGEDNEDADKCKQCNQILLVLLGQGRCSLHFISRVLLIHCRDESVRFWNVHTGICILIFAGAGGMDNTVKIWSMKDSKLNKRILLTNVDAKLAVELKSEQLKGTLKVSKHMGDDE